MSEYQIVKHCAPTLAGLKAGNLIRVSYTSLTQLNNQVKHLNSKINPKGIYITKLFASDKDAWLYTFRPGNLNTIMKDQIALNFLSSFGYDTSSIGTLLNSLRLRLSKYDEKDNFPHEIGIFLGYPVNDVISFYNNKGKNYLLSGPWKVYHDVCSAKCIFEKHRKCTEIYCERYQAGIKLEKLAVRSS
ncbi:DUF3793 family protein [Eubacteriales bacterium KG127]